MKTEYRVMKRLERIEQPGRSLFRVTLTPDDETIPVLVTVEALEGADGPLRPVLPLSTVDEDTLLPVTLSRKDLEIAIWSVVSTLAAEDDDLLDNTPGW